MKDYTLSRLSSAEVLRNADELIARECLTTADLLAHIAVIDVDRLFLQAAFPSMHAWCVRKMGLTKDAAFRRIQAARTARAFPAIFHALADGRLHLTAVCVLAPQLSSGNAAELLGAAAGKTTEEIEAMLAERFPRTELLPLVEAVPASRSVTDDELALTQVAGLSSGSGCAPVHVHNASKCANVAPIARHRFALHFSIGQLVLDKLRCAQELFSHQIPPGDLEAVFELALDQLIRVGEKSKFAGTDRPQRTVRASKNPRHIPNRVKREVWKRDGGQCTFVSESGERCPARTLIEYDHVEEVARGGRATVNGVRLRCRAHNQYTAEQAFGREFMEHKREEARAAAMARAGAQAVENARLREGAIAREAAVERERRAAEAAAAERARELDVVPWLRALGFRAEEANRVSKLCEAIPDATLEERVKFALSRCTTRATPRRSVA